MRSLIITVILLVLSGQVAASNSSAEDLTNLSIEELLNVEVISASRLGQKASLTPSTVSVLTAKDIRTFGWRTLADALNAMRGLFTSNDRNYSYLGVRGFIHPNDYNSRVLFMIDGQRMNENIFDGGYMAQEFMLDMDMVDHIEYIPGSGSSIYGANAFLGLINVVTKTGHDINGAQLDGQVGSFNTYIKAVPVTAKNWITAPIFYFRRRITTAPVLKTCIFRNSTIPPPTTASPTTWTLNAQTVCSAGFSMKNLP